jgi:hypothetical protein
MKRRGGTRKATPAFPIFMISIFMVWRSVPKRRRQIPGSEHPITIEAAGVRVVARVGARIVADTTIWGSSPPAQVWPSSSWPSHQPPQPWQVSHRVWAAMAAAVLVGRPDPAQAQDPGCGLGNSKNRTAGGRLGVFTGLSRR